jgi:hypothetical protein
VPCKIEVQKDGTDALLGDIHADRCGYPDIQNGAEKARLVKANEARKPGDKDLVWCIGGEHAFCAIYTTSLSALLTVETRLPCQFAPWERHHEHCVSYPHEAMDYPPDGCPLDARRDV